MSRTCTICDHPEIAEIDRHLLSGRSYRDIAGHFGTSKSSLERHHKGGHIPEAMTKAKGAKEEARADKLLDDLKTARDRTYSLLDKAEASADTKVYGAPVAYLKEIREQLKFIAELEGKIASQPQINFNQVNIYQSEEWHKVGEMLAEVLAGYPELRREVAGRLLELAREGR